MKVLIKLLDLKVHFILEKHNSFFKINIREEKQEGGRIWDLKNVAIVLRIA